MQTARNRGRSERGIMVTLFCAIVGVKGNVISIDIEAIESVGVLKKAMKKRKEKTITCDASKLELFLAKKGDACLRDDDQAAQYLEVGNIHQEIEALIDGRR